MSTVLSGWVYVPNCIFEQHLLRTLYLHVINLPPALPSRLTSVCFGVSGPQSRVPISNGSSNALLNHAVVKEGWNSMWRANRANPRRRQRNEKNLMRGTTAVPWNKITDFDYLKVLFTYGLYHTMWFSKGHFHFIIGLPEAQPNYKRSFHPSTKKRQNGEWITQKALHDLPPSIRPLILISWDGMGHFQRGGGESFWGSCFWTLSMTPSL